jgi:phage antirepressor YoqD-like protein
MEDNKTFLKLKEQLLENDKKEKKPKKKTEKQLFHVKETNIKKNKKKSKY